MSWVVKDRIPGVSTARHSSSDFSTGYAIFLEEEEDEELLLKKEPMKGIGIDERMMAGLKFVLKAGRNGNVRDVLLLKVFISLKRNGKEGNRMVIYFLREIEVCGS